MITNSEVGYVPGQGEKQDIEAIKARRSSNKLGCIVALLSLVGIVALVFLKNKIDKLTEKTQF